MSADPVASERLLGVLKPYASNWTGTLGKGDLVIPQREIPRLVRELLEAVREELPAVAEASDRDVFDVLMTARRSASVQDQIAALRRRFRLVPRAD